MDLAEPILQSRHSRRTTAQSSTGLVRTSTFSSTKTLQRES